MRRALALGLALLALAQAAGSGYFSGVLVAPRRRAPEADAAALAARWGPLPEPGAREVFRLPVTGGELAVERLRPPDPSGCVVVLLHGHGGTRAGALRLAPLFEGLGCALVAPDLRGHGESSAEGASFGALERVDVLALIDHLVEEGARRELIGVMGISMGGATALLTGAAEPELAFVAADSPYASAREIITHQGVIQYGPLIHLMIPGALAVAGWRTGVDLDQASPVDRAPDILVPTFILHPRGDTFTPAAHSEAIHAALTVSAKVLHLTEGEADHAEEIFVDPEGYRARLRAFLDEHVPGFGRQGGG